MAAGITNRTVLSMRDYSADPAGAIGEVKRWADQLPFGCVGWHHTNSANSPTIASGAIGVVTFDTILEDFEGFRRTANLIVPPGLSGLYVMESTVFWATSVPCNVAIWRTPRGGTQGGIGMNSGTADRIQVNAVARLMEGDQLGVSVRNGSGGNITITTYGGDTTTPAFPYFKGYRVALL